ncbi:hypothetical protein K1X76_01985 [bacterium]|nr:hypothetical protein [bacterium]
MTTSLSYSDLNLPQNLEMLSYDEFQNWLLDPFSNSTQLGMREQFELTQAIQHAFSGYMIGRPSPEEFMAVLATIPGFQKTSLGSGTWMNLSHYTDHLAPTPSFTSPQVESRYRQEAQRTEQADIQQQPQIAFNRLKDLALTQLTAGKADFESKLSPQKGVSPITVHLFAAFLRGYFSNNPMQSYHNIEAILNAYNLPGSGIQRMQVILETQNALRQALHTLNPDQRKILKEFMGDVSETLTPQEIALAPVETDLSGIVLDLLNDNLPIRANLAQFENSSHNQDIIRPLFIRAKSQIEETIQSVESFTDPHYLYDVLCFFESTPGRARALETLGLSENDLTLAKESEEKPHNMSASTWTLARLITQRASNVQNLYYLCVGARMVVSLAAAYALAPAYGVAFAVGGGLVQWGLEARDAAAQRQMQEALYYSGGEANGLTSLESVESRRGYETGTHIAGLTSTAAGMVGAGIVYKDPGLIIPAIKEATQSGIEGGITAVADPRVWATENPERNIAERAALAAAMGAGGALLGRSLRRAIETSATARVARVPALENHLPGLPASKLIELEELAQANPHTEISILKTTHHDGSITYELRPGKKDETSSTTFGDNEDAGGIDEFFGTEFIGHVQPGQSMPSVIDFKIFIARALNEAERKNESQSFTHTVLSRNNQGQWTSQKFTITANQNGNVELNNYGNSVLNNSFEQALNEVVPNDAGRMAASPDNPENGTGRNLEPTLPDDATPQGSSARPNRIIGILRVSGGTYRKGQDVKVFLNDKWETMHIMGHNRDAQTVLLRPTNDDAVSGKDLTVPENIFSSWQKGDPEIFAVPPPRNAPAGALSAPPPAITPPKPRERWVAIPHAAAPEPVVPAALADKRPTRIRVRTPSSEISSSATNTAAPPTTSVDLNKKRIWTQDELRALSEKDAITDPTPTRIFSKEQLDAARAAAASSDTEDTLPAGNTSDHAGIWRIDDLRRWAEEGIAPDTAAGARVARPSRESDTANSVNTGFTPSEIIVTTAVGSAMGAAAVAGSAAGYYTYQSWQNEETTQINEFIEFYKPGKVVSIKLDPAQNTLQSGWVILGIQSEQQIILVGQLIESQEAPENATVTTIGNKKYYTFYLDRNQVFVMADDIQ